MTVILKIVEGPGITFAKGAVVDSFSSSYPYMKGGLELSNFLLWLGA